MKILVTGAHGQLGRCLEDRLPASGHEWRSYGRAQLDIAHDEQVQAAVSQFHPDFVINAAAYTAVDAAESDAVAARRVNATGPAVLAHACDRVGATLLHVSTDYVFDGSAKSAYREDDTTNPLGVYGQTKFDGERAVLAASSQHVVLRTAWVFSEYGNNFLKTMLRLSGRAELSVVSDQVGGPTYAGDIAATLLTMAGQLRAGAAAGGIYHYGGEPPVSWHGFAARIFAEAEALGIAASAPTLQAIPTSDYPTPAARPAWSVLSNAKTVATFGAKPSDWGAAIPSVLHRLQREQDDCLPASPGA